MKELAAIKAAVAVFASCRAAQGHEEVSRVASTYTVDAMVLQWRYSRTSRADECALGVVRQCAGGQGGPSGPGDRILTVGVAQR